MDDGFNLLLYTFTLRALSADSTLVVCTVDCRMNHGAQVSSPSERLKRMMEQQDGTLVKRLKGFVEADPALLSVC